MTIYHVSVLSGQEEVFSAVDHTMTVREAAAAIIELHDDCEKTYAELCSLVTEEAIAEMIAVNVEDYTGVYTTTKAGVSYWAKPVLYNNGASAVHLYAIELPDDTVVAARYGDWTDGAWEEMTLAEAVAKAATEEAPEFIIPGPLAGTLVQANIASE